MKITERLQGLYAPDRPNQQETKVHKPNLPGKEIKVLSDAHRQKTDTNDFTLKQVLSVKEVNSLTALFGYEQNGGDGIYGANKMSNVHSGMLLDVKG